MFHADLVVITGAGGFTDHSYGWNHDVLTILELAQQRGIPTVMFGQGMGPLYDTETRRRAAAILPHVNLIALRESRTTLPLLESLGVSQARILTTGDDAIELAYAARTSELGAALGINLRVASYADIQKDIISSIRPILHDFAQRHTTQLLPVPIALHAAIDDVGTIRQLLAGYADADGGQRITTTSQVIVQVGRCRVVVTGAYHASIFALSQGIPVVCLAKSEYYINKYLGLAELFGTGCEIVSMSSETFVADLAAALERAWHSADEVRPALLTAGRKQIDAGWAAYQRAKMLLAPTATGVDEAPSTVLNS
jgi:colanic acid/amylovoran biosynthesis protein